MRHVGWREAAVIGATSLAMAGPLTGCGSEGDAARSEERYCAAVISNADALNSPAIATQDDVDETLDLFRSIAELAPLAIEPEWATLTNAVETASTVIPADQASVQSAADAIRSSQQAANAISDYSARLCNVMIGTTTVPVPVTLPPTPPEGG